MNEMQVIRVRYWAAARSAAGVTEETVEVLGPLTLAELRSLLSQRHAASKLPAVLEICSVLLGEIPVGSSNPAAVLVPPGSTVEFLPPFAGG